MAADTLMREVLVEREYDAHDAARAESFRVLLRIGRPTKDTRAGGD